MKFKKFIQASVGTFACAAGLTILAIVDIATENYSRSILPGFLALGALASPFVTGYRIRRNLEYLSD